MRDVIQFDELSEGLLDAVLGQYSTQGFEFSRPS